MSTPSEHVAVAPRRSSQSGFGLIEALIALSVATVSILAMLWSNGAAARLQQQTAEYGAASLTIARVHETLRSGTLDERFAEYELAPDFADGSLQVEVRFPEQAVLDYLADSGFAELNGVGEGGGSAGGRGPVGGAVLAGWRYRDLDGDGDVELDPAATEARSLLPVRVTVRWSSGEMRSTFLVTER